MNYSDLLIGPSDDGQPTRAGLIGVGQFGRSLLAQSRHIPSLTLPILCDLDVDAAVAAAQVAGVARADIAICLQKPAARAASAAGRLVVTDDPLLAMELGLDVVVEATGDAQAGAANCLTAIDHGCHIVLVTKETDCLVGPLLSRKAKAEGLVLSQVDGDQPSLLLGLMSWAQTLGLSITCAGKASEYDFVYDGVERVVRVGDDRTEIDPDTRLWARPEAADPAGLLRDRAHILRAFAQRTPPDFCEMCLVANGSGLLPDTPDLHAPIARQVELVELLRSAADGGILSGSGRLDIFNCFRRPDEMSAAGGVFIVAQTPDRSTGELFKAKGLPVSADARYVLIHNPVHLLGAEAPISILTAHRLQRATGSSQVRPVCDVVMQATSDLAAGTLLNASGSHHRIPGITPQLVAHEPLCATAAAPYFLAAGAVLTQPVAAGARVPIDAVGGVSDTLVWQLRREQDGLRF